MTTPRTRTLAQHLRTALLAPDGAGLTDGQLLACYLERRDETAFAALVHRHGPMVLGVCLRVLRGQHDAEDAFQATFLVLAKKAASVWPRERVGHWLYGVARTTALRARVAAAKRRAREAPMPEPPDPAPPRPGLWADLLPLLDEEIGRLPAKYRAPIVLCDLEGKTHQEAARQLGWPQGTVSGRLSRGRQLLANRLARYGCTLTGAALGVALSELTAAAAVPAALLASTTSAASVFATGQAAVGALAAPVAALTKGVLQSMFLNKLLTTAVVLLVLVLGLFGAASFMYQALGNGQASPPQEQASAPNPLSKAGDKKDKKASDQPLKHELGLEEGAEKQLKQAEAKLEQLQKEVAGLKARVQVLEGKLKALRPEKAESGKSLLKIYSVGNLLGTKHEENGAALVRIIMRTVEPKSWDATGGPGTIDYFAEARSLVVSHPSPEVHQEVLMMLQRFREAVEEQAEHEKLLEKLKKK
jgi:RNA polymerase sigma-70 factor (ECF subfamily)